MSNQPQFGMPLPGKSSMTVMMIVVFVAAFILGWLPSIGETLRLWLAFVPGKVWPWTFFSYPLASVGDGGGFLFFLIGMLWFFWVGNAFEAAAGKVGLLLNFLAFGFLFALVDWLAFVADLGGAPLLGPFLPVAGLTVAWCGMAPNMTIRIWGIIPVTGTWLAVITAAFVILGYGQGLPLFGVILALPLLLAWFYGQGRLPVRIGQDVVGKQAEKKKDTREFDEFMSKVKNKEKDREERERLRKLFEDSLDD